MTKSLPTIFVACVLALNTFAQQIPEPILRSAQMPKYPVIARTARVVGKVKAEFTLDDSGNVDSIHILSGPGLLQDATREDIQTWKFDVSKQVTESYRRYKTTFTYRFSGREVGSGKTLKLTVTLNSFHDVEIVTDTRKPERQL